MATIDNQNQSINFEEYTPQQFVSMMDFLQKFMTYYVPNEKFGGFVYIFKTASDQAQFNRFKDTDIEEARKYVHLYWKEGTDKVLSIELESDKYSVLLGSTGNVIKYTFVTLDGGAKYPEGVTVNYTIECGGAVQTVQQVYPSGRGVEFNVDKYLKEGTNNITIIARGNISKVTTNAYVTFEVSDLSVDTNFSVAGAYFQERTIDIKVLANGVADDGENISVEFRYDNVPSGNSLSLTQRDWGKWKDYTLTSIPSQGKHTLQVRASAKIGGTVKYSKVQYYEFVVQGDTSRYVTIARTLPDSNFVGRDFTIKCEQYVKERVPYGYISPYSSGESALVTWQLMAENGDAASVGSTIIDSGSASANEEVRYVEFMPTSTGAFILRATIKTKNAAGNYVTANTIDYPVLVKANTSGLLETEGTTLRLLALGRNNSEEETARAVWANNGFSTTFDDMKWNSQSGWYDNALVLSGGSKATINLAPLSHMTTTDLEAAATVEVDFEVFSASDDNAVLLSIGDSIVITASSATLKSGSGTSITERFPANTRMKLAFVIHPKNDKYAEHLLFEIINNGVSSRAASYISTNSFYSSRSIVVGGTDKAGIKLYGIRCYRKDLSTQEELNNVIIDSPNIAIMVERNDIYAINGSVDVDKLKNRIPCLAITGKDASKGGNNLQSIWDSENKVMIYCDAEWTNPLDGGKSNWRCLGMRCRSHGQSTLKNPLKSLKIWFKDDGTNVNDPTRFFQYETDEDGNSKEVEDTTVDHRWSMKDGSMPQNKFVAQCYYIDSSNCKSPAQLSIIDEVMRKSDILTPPQSFVKNEYKEVAKKDFPYTIRQTPDSIPCIVISRLDSSSPWHFDGIFVLMDDKKSDYLYGERTIYNCDGDPFCFLDEHDKNNYAALWNNENVSRFEFISNVHPIVTGKRADEQYFYQPPFAYDEEDDDPENIETLPEGGESTIPSGNQKYAFEQALEIIYPDYDDFYNNSGVFNDTKYRKHTERLRLFLDWTASCYQLWGGNESNTTGRTAALQKFWAEAADHMNLDHWAAYYVIAMMNGCFDSLVRNMQLTTFSVNDKGFHVWLPLWWDIDIQYGTINTGPLRYMPPVDRQTEGAFRGDSSWIWYALEAWVTDSARESFLDRCQRVLNTLTKNGYTFDNLVALQDSYIDKWPEALYNESQMFKYKQMYYQNTANSGYLAYLLGDGKTFRRWWMKNQFDYWFARLAAGSFMANGLNIRLDVDAAGKFSISVSYGTDTYFGYKIGDFPQAVGNGYSKPVKSGDEIAFTPSQPVTNSDNITILSPHYLRKVDASNYGLIIGRAELQNCYDAITGTMLEEVRIGKESLVAVSASASNMRSYRNTTTELNFTQPSAGLPELRTIQMQGYAYAPLVIDLSKSVRLENILMKGSIFSDILFPPSVKLSTCELPDTLSSLAMRNVELLSKPKFFDAFSLAEYTFPHSAKSLSLQGMGNNLYVKALVLDWIRYVCDNPSFLAEVTQAGGSPLEVTAISWTLTMDELRLLGRPELKQYRNLVGLVTVDKEFTNEEISELKELFNDDERGINCFTLASPFKINSTKAGFVLSAPSQILAGNNGSVVASVFPLTDSGYEMRYTIIKVLYNGQTIESGFGSAGSRTNVFRNFTIDTVTGRITTTETPNSKDKFTVTIRVQATGDKNYTTSTNIVMQPRVYPQSVSLIGDTQIGDQTNRSYRAVFDSAYENADATTRGTMQSANWQLEGADENIYLYVPNLTSITAVIHPTYIDDDRDMLLKFSSQFVTGDTASASLVINVVLNPSYVILTDATQWELTLLNLFHAAGLCSSFYSMLRSEARAVETLPSSFQNNPDITRFPVIYEFRNLTSLNLSGCSNLSSKELNVSKLTKATTINLQNTHASIKF